MNYIKYQFFVDSAESDLLIGHLSVLPFEAFEERHGEIDAYLTSNQNQEQIKNVLDELKNRYHFTFQTEVIPNQNWNTVWESNFSPIQIENFCYIHAPFHQPHPTVKHNILIEPKMAFGTGHHETTYMMIELMQNIQFRDLKVLDYGCGTGILAIMANRLGAKAIDAIDIDEWAVNNSIENIHMNNCSGINIRQGDINIVAEKTYAVILANINRNVILQTLPTLEKQLDRKGELLISGILIQDQDLILEKAKSLGLYSRKIAQKGEWCAIHFSCTHL